MYMSKAMSNLMYSLVKLQYMDVFYDTPSFLYNTATEEVIKDIEVNGNPAIKKYANYMSNKLLNNREVYTGIDKADKVLPEKAIDILKNITLTDKQQDIEIKDGIYMYVPLNGMFHVVIKKQRGAVFEGIMNITANKTAFKLFSIMLPYGMEPYSIAFRALDNSYGFALSFLQASSIRNKNSLFVTYFDENGYYTDDAGKYIDVSKFGVGL